MGPSGTGDFVIAADGTIHLACVDSDYTTRINSDEILSAPGTITT